MEAEKSTGLLERAYDLSADSVQLGAWGPVLVIGPELESEAVILETREDMQMNVKDFLSGGFAVSEEKIDSLAFHVSLSNRCGNSVRVLHQPTCCSGIEVGEIRSVLDRNHKHVSMVDWLNIHQRRALFVAIDESDGKLACEESAEDAIAHDVLTVILGALTSV